MFVHNFRYSLKYLLKNKMLLFWTYAFPLILGALFYFAFSNIENSEKLDVLDIAVVKEDVEKPARLPKNAVPSDREILLSVLETLSDGDGGRQLFHTVYVSESKAQKLLEEGKITGYLLTGEETPKVVVKESGVNETIFSQAVSEILQTVTIAKELTEKEVGRLYMENPGAAVDIAAVSKEVFEKINGEQAQIRDTSGEHMSYTMIEYYTLIAMSCLYCATIGMYAVNCILANMSKKGMRISVSPAKKSCLVLGSLCASYVVQLLGLAILFLFTIFVLKVDYGSHMGLVILLALAGSLAGLSMGVAVGALVKSNENAKTGLIIAVSMAGCFLSGMMGITMKYVIDSNVPLLNRINPAAMITDGLYSLYYYDTFRRYWTDVLSLLIFSGVMTGLSFFALKRQRYESL